MGGVRSNLIWHICLIRCFSLRQQLSHFGLQLCLDLPCVLKRQRAVANCIADPRVPEQVTHQLDEIVRCRMLMIAAGYAAAPIRWR